MSAYRISARGGDTQPRKRSWFARMLTRFDRRVILFFSRPATYAGFPHYMRARMRRLDRKLAELVEARAEIESHEANTRRWAKALASVERDLMDARPPPLFPPGPGRSRLG